MAWVGNKETSITIHFRASSAWKRLGFREHNRFGARKISCSRGLGVA
ncbi:hypothetical protein BVRB_9g212580 [Beta vulgaris subsp. vulgaris]|nr:hypothetical protein BVRB_9g212580 [Beta vulgaris subsp. vulgaris]